MKDPRLKKLAQVLLQHSLKTKAGDKILIAADVAARPLVKEIVEEAYALNAIPFVELKDEELHRFLAMHGSEEQFQLVNKWELAQYQDVDSFIALVAEENDAAFNGVPSEQFVMAGKTTKPANDYLHDNLKWVLVNYPTKAAAQKAKKSYDDFFDYVMNVTTADYEAMEQAQRPLKELMDKTENVHITGPGTDLRFSIKGMTSVMCYGERNVPDGEVYTAPVLNSVNGTITYNTPSPYQGVVHENVSFTFENGKIVKATSNHTKELNEVLDTDEGSRFIGEFALGLNPTIMEPMGDILYDEKIAGSFHFTPGDAYDETDNGNNSSVHWDLVLIQRPEYGGGEIYFDDVLIRKDGEFVLEELKGLNFK